MATGAKHAAVGVLVCGVLAATGAIAQDMEPRSFSASPVGLNFLGIGYGWLAGSVLFDPTVPIDLHATGHGPLIGVGHSFNLFGDLGLVTAVVPYVVADVTGKVVDQDADVRLSGLADTRVRLSINLLGNPAMSPREFLTAPRRTIVGVAVSAIAPTGQYDDARLINIGKNRWAFRPEVGVSFPKGSWDFDAYAGAWFFTTNGAFFPGESERAQDPILAVQGHVSYEFRPRLWAAIDGTSYRGGSTRIDERDPSLSLNNSRAGVTVSLPVARYSLKVAYSSGVTARAGGNFKSLSVAWQMTWLSSRWSGGPR